MAKPTAKPGIIDIQPYVGGLHTVEGVDEVVVLASNEGPLGASPSAIKAYERLSGKLHLYPDGGADLTSPLELYVCPTAAALAANTVKHLVLHDDERRKRPAATADAECIPDVVIVGCKPWADDNQIRASGRDM